jgi:phenylpropionate dioxygenase-like ring-hydroxylating dioxygenase large terminal subunit
MLPDILDPAVWLTNEHPAWLQAWQPVTTVAAHEAAGGLLAVRLGGAPYVVVDGPDGVVAFADECGHGAPLSIGRLTAGVLTCRHGVAYRLGGGSLEGGTLEALPTATRFGLVWLAPHGPVGPLPEVPEWDDPDFTVVPMPVQRWNASAAQMADNFLDVAHFPFTHPGSIGDPDDREVLTYEVAREPWSFRVEHRHAARSLTYSMQPGEDPTNEMTTRSLVFVNTAPHHVYLRIQYDDSGDVVTICFFHCAVDAEHTDLYAFQIRNDMGPGGYSVAEVEAQQNLVANEDKQLLEQLVVKGIPRELGGELHVRADRSTVELRRLLGDLVARDAATLAGAA